MATLLFGIRTVQRQSSRVALSAQQRSAADMWLTMLEGGEMVRERENYLKFADIILRNILGYDITHEVNFEKGAEFTVPSSNGGGGAYALSANRTAPTCSPRSIGPRGSTPPR